MTDPIVVPPPQQPQQPQPQPAPVLGQPQQPSQNNWEATGPVAASSPALPAAWGNPVASLAASGAALLATFVTSGILLVLTLIGFSLAPSAKRDFSDATEKVGMNDLAHGVGVMLSMVVQLVGMAFLSPLKVAIEGGGEKVVVGVTLPILLLLAAHIAYTYVANRFSVRKWSVGTTQGTAVLAGASGLVVALVMTLLVRLFALSANESGAKVSVHAASLLGFVVAALVTFLAAHAGRMHGAGRQVLPQHPVAREVVRGTKVLGAHFVAYSTVAVAALALWMFVKVTGNEGFGQAIGSLLLLPLFVGHVANGAFGASALGGLSVSGKGDMSGLFDLGSSSSGTLSKSFSVFDLPWYVSTFVLLLSLLAIAAAGLVWSLRRRVGKVNQQAEIVSWAILPALYLAAGVVLWIVTRYGAGFDYKGNHASASIGLSGWTPLLLALLGLLVDLAARYVAPVLLPYLSPALRARLAGPEAAFVAAPAAGATASGPASSAAAAAAMRGVVAGAAAAGAAAAMGSDPMGAAQAALVNPAPAVNPAQAPAAWGAQQSAAMAPAKPLDEATKKKLKLAAIILGAVIGLLVIGSLVISQVNKQVFGPQHQAEQVMDAIKDGKAGKAVELMGSAAPEGSRALLTDEVYAKAQDRITGYKLDEVKVTGSDASVKTRVTQGSGEHDFYLSLTKAGKKFGIFDQWKISRVPVSSVGFQVPEGATEVGVNGITIGMDKLTSTGSSSGVEVPALPGTYSFSLADKGKYVVGAQADAVAPIDGASNPAQLKYSYSSQLAPDVEKLVNEKLDTCAKSTDAKPQGCPFETFTWGKVRNGKWTIKTHPTIMITEGYDSLRFTTETSGSAVYSFEQDLGYDKPDWKPQTNEVTVYPSGTVSLDGDKLDIAFGN